jgi:M6 family metalloprotease-like protein
LFKKGTAMKMSSKRQSARRSPFAYRLLTLAAVSLAIVPYVWAQQPAAVPPPLDPQEVQDQDDMTWADYKPIPGVNWTDPKHVAGRTINIALVVADFDDQPFVITLPKHSDLFGNPQIDPIPREQVATFYRDFWNKPQDINHHHTVHEYWMELSHGKVGVHFDAYGPYRMPLKMVEYGGTVNGARGFGGGTGGGGGGRRNRRGGGDEAAAQGQGEAAAQGGDKQAEPANQGQPGGEGEKGAAGGEGERRGGGRRGGGGGGGRPSLQGDLDAMWRPDSNGKQYDLVLRIYGGYDETCIWQEFGEMKFQTKDDIPPEWGNPDPTQPRWSGTRYIDWTSWKAGSYLWSNSSIIQGESSGSIRHEISHAAFSIGDNNNNPYVKPYHRVGSGAWDVMDRGSFNGPGGPHNRWQIPVQQGGSMPAGVMLSQQMKFGFLAPTDVVRLNRDELAKSGPVVAKIIPRNVVPGPDKLHGIAIALDGEGDRTPADSADTNPMYGGNGYNYYTMEVIQRMGYDSYSPDSGVLLAMNTGSIGDRNTLPLNEARRRGGGGRRGARRGGAEGDAGAAEGERGRGAQPDETGRGRGDGGGEADPSANAEAAAPVELNPQVPEQDAAQKAQPENQGAAEEGRGGGRRGGRGGQGGGTGRRTLYFNWVIDAHPEDMNRLDFKRPNGEPVMRTIADYRQLNDGLFHAGLNSGSQYEYVDRPNGLHFYVIDLEQDAHGIRAYTLGVRSLDGAGEHTRGVELAAPAAGEMRGVYDFTLNNTGRAAAVDANLHLQDTSPYVDSDIYRLSVSVDGAGWRAELQNALAALKFGASRSIPVYVTAGTAPSATITLTATSESDSSKSATATITVGR